MNLNVNENVNGMFWGLFLLLIDFKAKAVPNTKQLHILVIEMYYGRQQPHRSRA